MFATAATFALGALSAIGSHSAKKKAAKARNRERIMAYKEAQRQYTREVKFKNANWKNSVQDYKIQSQQNWQAMVSEWTELDLQLDEIYETYGFDLQKNLIESYKNQYAGEQTGVTASRLKGDALRQLGQQNSEALSKLMLAEKATKIGKEAVTTRRNAAQQNLWSQIYQAPVHGPTPTQPALEKGPSNFSLMLGLAQAGLSAYNQFQAGQAPEIGNPGPESFFDAKASGKTLGMGL